MSDSLQPHELWHARPPCLSPTPGVYSNSCPSSHWCHPAISSVVIPFSSCPQPLPASESFPMSQLQELVMGGLVCCDSWGRKELDTTERQNWTEERKEKHFRWEEWHGQTQKDGEIVASTNQGSPEVETFFHRLQTYSVPTEGAGNKLELSLVLNQSPALANCYFCLS